MCTELRQYCSDAIESAICGYSLTKRGQPALPSVAERVNQMDCSSVPATRWIVAAGMAIALSMPIDSRSADKTDMAISGLEFGGSLGKLLWVSVETRENVTASEGSRYLNLAMRVKERIEQGRATSSLVKANFDLVATTLAYTAIVDPEPVSKAVAGVAAWGAKKTGDALGNAAMEEFRKQSQAILAEGLRNSGLSQGELENMSAAELSAKVAEFRYGGKVLGEALKDQPESLAMLQAQAVDVATDIGVVALSKAVGTSKDVEQIKSDLRDVKVRIDAYQAEVSKHLDTLDGRVSTLEGAVKEANVKFDALTSAVASNAIAIQSLAEISYSGWTTSQKLQAVESGLFPNLNADQQRALIESLKADRNREQAVAGVKKAAEDLGNLAAIAANIGLPASTVQGIQTAQVVATGIAQFATGNFLGALASLTSLVGLGAPDAAAERHAMMMKYLERQFEALNRKLDRVIDLQVATLQAIDELAKDQRHFRSEVIGKLDRIEATVLRSETVLLAIMQDKWTECNSLINGPMNGQYKLHDRSHLVNVIRSQHVDIYATTCYATMSGFLDAWVKPATWSGQIIAVANFPSPTIESDAALRQAWTLFSWQQQKAYSTARDFVLLTLEKASTSPVKHFVRFGQPVVNAAYASELKRVLQQPSIDKRLEQYTCDDTEVLAPPLKELICFKQIPGSPTPPLKERWGELLGAALIGPHADKIVDTGIAMSSIVDFAKRTEQGSFTFVTPSSIERFGTDGMTADLAQALGERKGIDLLKKLRWLTEASVLQKSIAYGDYTAELVEEALYDVATRSLITQPATAKQRAALDAMRWNPLLARNVVMLAMRHAIRDSYGGAAKADAVMYRQAFYHLALRDLSGPQACNSASIAHDKLRSLLPNWTFEWRVAQAEQGAGNTYKDCPREIIPDWASSTPLPEMGRGAAVKVGDFYVLMPTPTTLTNGTFEQADVLRAALHYRDRVSQEIIDRTVIETLRESAMQEGQEVAKKTAFSLLNEGWGWSGRMKSKQADQ